jgi:nitroreductase
MEFSEVVPENLGPFRAEFGVPGEYAPIGGITVGYRADDLPPQVPRIDERRRSIAEVVHRGHWGKHG